MDESRHPTDDAGDRESFDLSRRLAASFDREVVVVEPGTAVPYVPGDWRSALVVVDKGEVEVTDASGDTAVFRTGDVLAFDGLDLRVLRAHGGSSAVLIAVTRRAG